MGLEYTAKPCAERRKTLREGEGGMTLVTEWEGVGLVVCGLRKCRERLRYRLRKKRREEVGLCFGGNCTEP